MAPMENAASERLSREGRFDLLDDGVEAGRIVNGHFGQRLAIQTDFGLAETVDEFAVAEAALTASGVDADDPQLAELALADAAVAEGIDAGADQSFLGGAEHVAATTTIAFNLLEQPALGFVAR